MRIVPAIIIAVGLVLAPVAWFALDRFLPGDNFGGSAIDSGARIEVEILRQQVEDLQTRLADMEAQISRAFTGFGASSGAQAPSAEPDLDAEDEVFRSTGPNDIIDQYATVVLIADRRNVNRGLRVATPSYLEQRLGRPRAVLSDDCEPMTNQSLKSKLVLEEVGPIRVRMLKPAVESLRRVFETVRSADPDLYARINTSGSLCVRRIRGTVDRLSTHSYGLAVDLNIDGQLDNFADGKTQLGLTILADFFHAEGWVWGAGFGREDSMHFEISRRQLDEWLDAGVL